MKCPYCTTTNRESRRFCGHCGVVLGWPCPRCAFFNLVGEQWCGGCGATENAPVDASPKEQSQSARAPLTARRAVIKDEIQTFIKDRANPEPDVEKKRVSQDDIDHLFRP